MIKMVKILSLIFVVLISSSCSFPNFDIQDNIIGGRLVESMSEIPYQVSLQEVELVDGQLITKRKFCGGTIIHPKWVLTAGHCIDPVLANKVPQENFYIKAGVTEAKRCDENSQTIRVKKIIKHPNWNGNIHNGYDVSLLELEKEFELNDNVQVALVPKGKASSGQYPKLKIGLSGVISGWGYDESGGSHVVKKTYVSVDEEKNCENDFRYFRIDSVCIGNTTHTACKGDSGGPFAVKDSSLNAYIVYGICSYGRKTCNKHGIYINVAQYADWIVNIVDDDLKAVEVV